MKTALKIVGGIIGALVLVVAVAYFGWLSPPAADAVCGNVERVTRDEIKTATGADPKDATTDLRRECLQRATKAPEFGRAVWVKQLKCMRDASDMRALKACDDIKTL